MQIDTSYEQWAPIPGFPGYEASDHGQVRNALTGRTLKQRQSQFGYWKVGPVVDGRSKMVFVHRLVMLAFCDPYPADRPFTNHINGQKLDNRLENLEFCSRSENVRHAFATGLHQGNHGERNSQAKLCAVDVGAIRSLIAGGLSRSEIGRRYGVTHRTISNIALGKQWGAA